MENAYKRELEEARKDTLDNIDTLEKEALTFEQLTESNKRARIFYKENKQRNHKEVIFNGVSYA